MRLSSTSDAVVRLPSAAAATLTAAAAEALTIAFAFEIQQQLLLQYNRSISDRCISRPDVITARSLQLVAPTE